MGERKFWLRLFRFFEGIGVLATAALYLIVVSLNDGDYLGTLLWFGPLLLLIEFGCFATQDRKHMKAGGDR